MKDDLISLSRNRVKKFQKEVTKRTLFANNQSAVKAKRNIIRYLYRGDYNWASSCLSIMNCKQDIDALNIYIMDCIRAVEVNEKKGKKGKLRITAVGGLGYLTDGADGVITRGKGKHVTRNRNLTEKEIEEYLTMGCLANIIKYNKQVFNTCVETLTM